MNIIHACRFQNALRRLTEAIREVEDAITAVKAEHDPLGSHIFVSRRQYRSVHDTKSGKRREVMAPLSYDRSCELGFCGTVDEWERLMRARAKVGGV